MTTTTPHTYAILDRYYVRDSVNDPGSSFNVYDRWTDNAENTTGLDCVLCDVTYSEATAFVNRENRLIRDKIMRVRHASEYASTPKGVAMFAFDRWLFHMAYYDSARAAGRNMDADIDAAKAGAYHEILGLITGGRTVARIREVIGAMEPHGCPDPYRRHEPR